MEQEEYIVLECEGCGYRKRVLKSEYELLKTNGQILLCERTLIASGLKCQGVYATPWLDIPQTPTSRP